LPEKEEDPVEPPSGRIKVRIESLSDLVFGLALSIGSIGFLSNPPHSAFGLAKNVAFFGFSFAILVFTWLGYSRTMAFLSKEKESALTLNLILLFLVAIEPYLFYILVTAATDYFANIFSTAYALDVGAMFLVQAALARSVINENVAAMKSGKSHLNEVVLTRFRGVMITEAVIGAIYLLSALPIFWEVSTGIDKLRFVLWYSSFAIFVVIRIVRRPRSADQQTETQKVSKLSEKSSNQRAT